MKIESEYGMSQVLARFITPYYTAHILDLSYFLYNGWLNKTG